MSKTNNAIKLAKNETTNDHKNKLVLSHSGSDISEDENVPLTFMSLKGVEDHDLGIYNRDKSRHSS